MVSITNLEWDLLYDIELGMSWDMDEGKIWQLFHTHTHIREYLTVEKTTDRWIDGRTGGWMDFVIWGIEIEGSDN